MKNSFYNVIPLNTCPFLLKNLALPRLQIAFWESKNEQRKKKGGRGGEFPVDIKKTSIFSVGGGEGEIPIGKRLVNILGIPCHI